MSEMPIVERVFAALFARLSVIAGIPGLTVARNDDEPPEAMPALVQQDADASQRVLERAGGATLYAVEVEIEGWVGAATPAATGPALNALYAAAWRATAQAAGDVPGLLEVLETEVDRALVREPGAPPRAMFSLTVELRFGAAIDDPFTPA